MNLYKITVEYETVIAAVNVDEAKINANYTIKHEDDGLPTLITVKKINSKTDIPEPWDISCIPFRSYIYSEYPNKTIGEYLDDPSYSTNTSSH